MIKRIIANQVKEFFGKRGYSITRARFHEENAIDLRALLAEPIEKRKGNFTVLQIGANDGISNDPVHAAVASRGWKLVAVEPMPGPFARLQETYRGNPKVTCVQCAIAKTDGEAAIYALRPEQDRGGTYDEHLASFSLETLRKNWRTIPGIDARIEKHTVNALSLESLVARYCSGGVDMLQIDVEGFDYDIVSAAFNMKLFPDVLAFEWVHLGREAMWLCRSDLIKHGYRWLLDKGDVIAVRSETPTPVSVQ
jgi:FkbM family methyltransferase